MSDAEPVRRNEKTIRQRVIVEVTADGAGNEVLKVVETLGSDVGLQKANTRWAQLVREERKKDTNRRKLELILR